MGEKNAFVLWRKVVFSRSKQSILRCFVFVNRLQQNVLNVYIYSGLLTNHVVACVRAEMHDGTAKSFLRCLH